MLQQPEMVSKCYEKEILERQSDVGGTNSGRNDPEILDIPSSQMATTQFIDDAIVNIEEDSHVTMVNDSFLKMNDTQSVGESMESFLARPIKLYGGKFATTDLVTTITDFNFPNDVFASTYSGIWTEKLKGYYGIRCDFRVKIVFNSNRFQQGRYMLTWLPMCGTYITIANNRLAYREGMMQHSLVQRTTCKHVEFDINSGTSAELVIPYASVDTFFPIDKIVAGQYDRILGVLSLCPYSPLVAPSGSTVVPYTIYVSLENVRLFGAVEPQSDLSIKRGKGVSEKESAIPNGPISGVAKRFANAFDALSGVPLIGGYALGASWISDRISQTASIFGYSKPNQGDSNTKVVLSNNSNHCNVDGDCAVKPLSFLAKPSTVPLVGASGSDIDQMDFSYIKTIPAWHSTITWTTLNLEDANLDLFKVTPHHWHTSTDGYRNYPPCSFIASHFNAWRGSMRFVYKFVKTEFHSGRLSFEFVPTTNPTLVQAANPSYLNRQIVDIREIDEVEVIVPYISTTPWSHPNEVIGVLYIRIVDPLVAPATVSSSITILREMAGGDDLEFAMPSAAHTTPMSVVDRQSGITSSRKVSFTIGNSTVASDDVLFSATSIGDKISSLRSYLKRYTSLNPCGNQYRLNLPMMIVQPDVIFVPPSNVTTGSYGTTDMLGKWATCFGMWSGGTRLKAIVNTPCLNIKDGVFKVTTYSRNHNDLGTMSNLLDSIGFINNKIGDSNQVVLQQNCQQNSTIEVEVPQYTLSIARAVGDCMTYNNAAVDADRPRLESMTQLFVHFCLPRFVVVNGTDTNIHLYNLYRAGADDLNLSIFISVPPMSVAETYIANHQYAL